MKSSDLVHQRADRLDWLTVTPPRPDLGLGTDMVHAGSTVRVVVSGLRTRTKYVAFSSKTRTNASDPSIGGGADPPAVGSGRTDVNGRASIKITIAHDWCQDHLIEVKKKKGGNVAVQGADAWLTVVR
ncbi:hypothetical protein KIH74_05400 [Kineosporia sp. J2-2]|uniref:Uncharacterized protein n=1 Tax=Kineosporia corallincola TaxID=2835133 RepID=A0ABS5TB92_9ACTN|nr:hypothetical protein [Kineosporia corallincola]MBT0768348.1 hypothetical protein [Kineosporia corallincola]